MSDYEHHAPRVINKTKKNRNGFNEEVTVKRQDRISFKNYIREMSEQENGDFLEEAWVVERGILLEKKDKFLTWSEIAAFADEESANDELDSCRELEVGDAVFRARLV